MESTPKEDQGVKPHEDLIIEASVEQREYTRMHIVTLKYYDQIATLQNYDLSQLVNRLGHVLIALTHEHEVPTIEGRY